MIDEHRTQKPIGEMRVTDRGGDTKGIITGQKKLTHTTQFAPNRECSEPTDGVDSLKNTQPTEPGSCSPLI